jgi:hypothetical protein
MAAGYALAAALLGAVLSQVPWPTLAAAVGAGEPTYDEVAVATKTVGEGTRSQADAGQAVAATEPATPWRGRLHVTPWGRDFRVTDVARRSDGALVPPDDVFTLGRWDRGARPGSGTGTVVLVAHRDSNEQGRGPFAALEQLSAGSGVTLNGRTYRLEQIATYPKQDLPSERVFRQRGPERLVIVTCGGSFSDTNGWDANVVASFRPSTPRARP